MHFQMRAEMDTTLQVIHQQMGAGVRLGPFDRENKQILSFLEREARVLWLAIEMAIGVKAFVYALDVQAGFGKIDRVDE